MLLNLTKRSIFQNFAPEIIADKFKGCLIGSLIGDCFGKPFAYSDEVSRSLLQSYFDKLNGPYFKAPFKPYSANTAFSLCLANSLISNGKFDALDVAKQFVTTFYQDPNRDYGSTVAKVCVKLRATKFKDPFGPAAEQFNCAGSFGNRAATRVTPLVLLYQNNAENMVNSTLRSSEITHSNNMACYGALLQAWAIRLALELDCTEEVNHTEFLRQLISKVEAFAENDLDKNDALKFSKQLEIVGKLLDRDDVAEYDVVNILGHGKIALFSVPTAVYCFLRGMKPIDGIVSSNAFRRTVQFAVLLGGDAVSIASMTGAMAGAFYGCSIIDNSLILHCENSAIVADTADRVLKWHLNNIPCREW